VTSWADEVAEYEREHAASAEGEAH